MTQLTQVQFLDLTPQYSKISSEIKEAVGRVLDSQQFILKDNVLALENKMSQEIGVKHAIGCASGSDALYLALLAMGIGPGDEVVTTAFTFFATAGSISRVGATPVFADIDARTFNLDPQSVEKKITKKTKAIIAVHLFGLCSDMDALGNIAQKHGIYIIEDMAQSYGATFKGQISGSMSDVACLSFFPTKNLGGSGDGGMVVTKHDAIADKIKLLRVHGSKKKYHHEVIGINSRLDEIQAAVLLVKAKYIDGWNAARVKNAKLYDSLLKDSSVTVPYVPQAYGHVYHLYSVLSDNRDALCEYLTKQGIGVGVYYPLALHLQICYKNLGYKAGDLPVTEDVCKKIFSLPMYPELGEDSIRYVAQSIKSFSK